MALCSEACGPGSGGESCENEEQPQAGSSCHQFGVRSYLHLFYEECSSSVWERDQGGQRFVQSQGSTSGWNSAVWKVSLALGLLVLTAGIASLSVGYSTPHKIESFGEGELFFVDAQAVSFNRGLNISTTAGIWLVCLGLALAAMGVVVWILPRANLKERMLYKQRPGEQTDESVLNWRGLRVSGEVVIEPPGTEGKTPGTPSAVENILPVSSK